MSEPISKIKRMEIPEEQNRENNLTETLDLISEHKAAIEKGIELLGTLEESGLLDTIHAFIKHKDTAVEATMEHLNVPKYSDTMENLMRLTLLAGSLNMDDIEHFAKRINEGASDARIAQNMEKTTYTDLFKALKEPEINRSITMILEFLKGMGK